MIKFLEVINVCSEMELYFKRGSSLFVAPHCVFLMTYSCIKCWQYIGPFDFSMLRKVHVCSCTLSDTFVWFYSRFAWIFFGRSELMNVILQFYIWVENYMKTVAAITVCCPSTTFVLPALKPQYRILGCHTFSENLHWKLFWKLSVSNRKDSVRFSSRRLNIFHSSYKSKFSVMISWWFSKTEKRIWKFLRKSMTSSSRLERKT